jgi:hypothetical protein
MMPERIQSALMHAALSYSVNDKGVSTVVLDFDEDRQGLAYEVFEWLEQQIPDPVE